MGNSIRSVVLTIDMLDIDCDLSFRLKVLHYTTLFFINIYHNSNGVMYDDATDGEITGVYSHISTHYNHAQG